MLVFTSKRKPERMILKNCNKNNLHIMHLNDDSMPNYHKQDETEAYYFQKEKRERER